MVKRVLSMVIVLALCFTMLPATALAIDTGLWVGGVKVTGNGPITGTGIRGTVTYNDNGTTKTLTLDNATITSAHSFDAEYDKVDCAGIYYNGFEALTIKLVGHNTIEESSDLSNQISSYGIYYLGNLKFTGDGSLKVTAGDGNASNSATGNSWSMGIYAYDLNIESDCTIVAVCGNAAKKRAINASSIDFPGYAYVSANADGSGAVAIDKNSYPPLNNYMYVKIGNGSIPGGSSSSNTSSGTHDGIGSVGADARYYDADTDQMRTDVKHITYGDAAYYPLLINRSGDPVTDRRMVENLKIKVKYTQGEDLIEGEPQLVKVCVNGEYRYFIKFNIKQSLEAQMRDVCGTLTLNKSKKGDVTGMDYRVKDLNVDFDFEVGAEYNYADGTYPTVVDDPVMPIWPNEFFILKYDCDDEVEFEFGSEPNEGSFTVDVSGQGKNLITFNTEIDENIAAANPDAKMIAISFNNVRFNRSGVFNYEADDMKYAYEIKNGVLVKIAEFANGEVEFNTNTLGRYIFSDVELTSPATIGEAVFIRQPR